MRTMTRRCGRCGGKGWVRNGFAIVACAGFPILLDKIATAAGFDEDEEMTRDDCPRCGGAGVVEDDRRTGRSG